MTPETEALIYYRKLASLLYREIGAMKQANHPELYDKSKIAAVKERRREDPKRIYHESKSTRDVETIDRHYVEWSRLTLEEVSRAFRDGDWLLGSTRHSFGGPKWASVAEVTLTLRKAILTQDWGKVPQLVKTIKGLHHNNGLVVDKFKQLDP